MSLKCQFFKQVLESIFRKVKLTSATSKMYDLGANFLWGQWGRNCGYLIRGTKAKAPFGTLEEWALSKKHNSWPPIAHLLCKVQKRTGPQKQPCNFSSLLESILCPSIMTYIKKGNIFENTYIKKVHFQNEVVNAIFFLKQLKRSIYLQLLLFFYVFYYVLNTSDEHSLVQISSACTISLLLFF